MTERFEPEDLLRERRITDIHALPGHPAAICAVQSIDDQGEKDQSTLWSFGLNAGEARQLTHGPALDRHPRLSPDARQIAFLSDRAKAGTAQIHLLPSDGGEARPLSRLERGVLSAAWQPQGRWLLVRGNTTVDPNWRSGGCQRQDGASAQAPDPQAPQLCWRLPYKHDGAGYVLDTRIHLFLVDAHSGDSHQLTHGDFDVRHAAWAPDGRRVCFSRTREKPGQEHCTDIWSLSLKGHQPGNLQRLSFDQEASSSPSWSPDGRWIVFSGALEAGDAQSRLWLIDVEAATVRPLGDESLEVLPGELHWSRDAAEVALIHAVRGLQQIGAVAVPGGQARCIVGGERHIAQLAANGALVYTSETAAAPLELFCSRWHGGEERPLSPLNGWWAQRRSPHVAYRSFEVPDGRGGTESVDGWLLRPAAGTSPARPGPLLVDVHGGPASYAALDFSSHPYWQTLCSRGWSVLALNAVGSSSYGRAFSERLRGQWGKLDLPQHLAAIDQLRREGIADDRLAITGASYGGYLAAYAIGHCQRFRAAVVCAPVANMESHFGTSDSGYYADAYSTEGDPDAQRALLARLSPMNAIAQVRTPTLFLQGTDDERCPRGQSEELFVRLRRAGGAATEMVLYPGGSHAVFSAGRPAHRVDIQRRILAWLERWAQAAHPRP